MNPIHNCMDTALPLQSVSGHQTSIWWVAILFQITVRLSKEIQPITSSHIPNRKQFVDKTIVNALCMLQYSRPSSLKSLLLLCAFLYIHQRVTHSSSLWIHSEIFDLYRNTVSSLLLVLFLCGLTILSICSIKLAHWSPQNVNHCCLEDMFSHSCHHSECFMFNKSQLISPPNSSFQFYFLILSISFI